MQSASRRHAARSCWSLAGTRANLAADNLSGRIDVSEPHHGLQGLKVAGRELDEPQLAVRVGASGDHPSDWAPHEAYARGDDLVATYRQPCGEPFNLQLYWRLRRGLPGALGAIDVIASIHTPLWEAYPAVAVQTAPGEPVERSSRMQVRRIGQLFRLEITRPGDFEPADVQPLRWQFGGVFMERGVIRKLHLRTIWLAAPPDEATVTALLHSFDDDLPLTA